MTACRDVAYNEFGRRVQTACAGGRVPLSGSIEITFRCNLRCVHCYIPDYSGRGEMSAAEIERILSEAADAGCLWLLLTGGEVLLRPDFPRIYRHAKRLGCLVTVFSNGTLLDERIADLLAEYPPFGIEFTLYGLSDETYLKTTGFPGRFTKVRRAIDLCVERGLPLSLKAVAMEPLRGEIEGMRRLAEERGLAFRYDTMVHGRLDGSAAPLGVRTAPEDAVRFDRDDPRRIADWLEFYKGYVAPGPQAVSYLMSCGAGVNAFHVDPRGTLLTCEALPLEGYDLRRGSFREGWEAIGLLRHRRAAPHNVCTACELKAMCDRCPATALLETGSPDGWIPWYCEITHRRAALLEETLGHGERAARYLAHAERVAAGWTPPGAVLPRAGAPQGAAACGAGGCVPGGCVKSARPEEGPQLIQIERPRATAAGPEVS